MEKMETRAKNIRDELLRKQKEREEEEKKLMIKNEMRKKMEEKERKQKLIEQKIKEEEYQKKLNELYSLRNKNREKIEKQLLLKDKIQKKNLELIKKEKDKQIKARNKSTDERTQKAYDFLKLKYEQKNEKDKLNFLQKNKLIEEKLNKQKDLEKKEFHQRLIQSAIKREEIEDNLRKKERILQKNRLKILNEIEEKDKKINILKLQKKKIWDKQQKMNKNYEKNREKLFQKFNSLMLQRNKKSKEEIIEELLDGKNKNESLRYKNKYSNLKFDSVNRSANIINNNNKIKDEIFLTNLSMKKAKEYESKE